MPDDDWALGQNVVDVRNEARRARQGWPDGGLPHGEHPSDYDDSAVPSVFVCHDPEQAWIDESRAEAEREDTANEERTG